MPKPKTPATVIREIRANLRKQTAVINDLTALLDAKRRPQRGRSLTTVCNPLELAQLIESDLAHWRGCQQWPCGECAFIEKVLALAGNMIFSEPQHPDKTPA